MAPEYLFFFFHWFFSACLALHSLGAFPSSGTPAMCSLGRILRSPECTDCLPSFCGCQKITCIYFEIMLPAFLFYINIIPIYHRELRKYNKVHRRNLNNFFFCHPERTPVNIWMYFLSGFLYMYLHNEECSVSLCSYSYAQTPVAPGDLTRGLPQGALSSCPTCE